jgi:hypothetical protein
MLFEEQMLHLNQTLLKRTTILGVNYSVLILFANQSLNMLHRAQFCMQHAGHFQQC